VLLSRDAGARWGRLRAGRRLALVINLGPGNLQIRGGGQIAPCVIDGEQLDQCTVATQEILNSSGRVALTHLAGVACFHPEHHHWHQSGVAESKIMTSDPIAGSQVATGVKIRFCFVDVVHRARRRRQEGAAAHLLGVQRRPLGPRGRLGRRVPPVDAAAGARGDAPPGGRLLLDARGRPYNHWLEGPTATSPGGLDNFTWVKFHLDRSTGANPFGTVIGHSPCTCVQCGYGGNPLGARLPCADG
jgi:hypothetical protein